MSTRFINDDIRSERVTSLAQLSDVNHEEFRKRYMERVKEGSLPDDNRTVTEKQAEEDTNEWTAYAEWLDIQDEIAVDCEDPLETVRQFSLMMEEGNKELFELAESQRQLNVEEDAADKIEQLTEFTVNTDDPLLTKEFKEKKESLIKSIEMQTERMEQQQQAQTRTQESRSYGSSSINNSSSGFTYQASRSTTGSTSTSQTVSSGGNEQRSEMYQKGMSMMKSFVIDGGKPAKRERSHTRFYGKKKFRFKSLMASIKKWFRSDEARLFTKVGIGLCFELGLAVIVGKYQFDGPGQTLAFLAMMMGGFYISRELFREGYDPRKLSFL